jgi:hypothetical protein
MECLQKSTQQLPFLWHRANKTPEFHQSTPGNREFAFGRDAIFRVRLPVQTVDATPSKTLLRQHFPGGMDLFAWSRSKPSQGSVPADLNLASDFSFCYHG